MLTNLASAVWLAVAALSVVAPVAAQDSTGYQAMACLNNTMSLTAQVTSDAEYGSDAFIGVYSNVDAFHELTYMINNGTKCNGRLSQLTVIASKPDQAKICDTVNDARNAFRRTHRYMNDAIIKDMNHVGKGSFAGLYADRLRKLKPVTAAFLDNIIRLVPSCARNTKDTKGVLTRSDDDTIETLEKNRFYIFEDIKDPKEIEDLEPF